MTDMTERTEDVEGFEVHTVEWAAGSLPVLLVHGLGGNSVSWEPFGERLAEPLGATVTAFDLPGHGLTRLPPGRHADFATHSVVLDAVVDGLGPSIVVGNSMGGTLSVSLAARRPDIVRGLVLLDPAQPLGTGQHPHWGAMVRMAPAMFPPFGRFVLNTRARILGAQRVVDATLASTMVDPSRVDPELRLRFIAMATTRAGFPEATGAFVESARSLFWYLTRKMPADLARVSSPTLVVHGENDRLVAVAASRALGDRRPDFTIETIADCGHTPQLECPDHVVDLVGSWVTNVLPAR